MSLVEHAERELRLAGLFDKDSDYGGMIGEAVLGLVRTFAEQGHSGMSASYTLFLFNKVGNYKPLTKIGTTKEEWMNVSDYGCNKGKPLYQNIRSSSCFSEDGGETYWDIDAPKKKWYQLWVKADQYGRIIRRAN